jgi:ABC-type multidrug transport system fused ATPase/permease subunit
VRTAGLACGFAAAELVRYGAFLVSWLVLGGAVLDGAVLDGHLTGATIGWWALALAVSLGCGAGTVRLQAALVVLVGGRLRRRLLAGLLQLGDRERDLAGSGLLLGRSFEVETVEDQIAGDALRNLGAPVDLVLAAVLLGAALGPAAVGVLVLSVAAAALAAHRYGRHRRIWTVERLRLGAELTEQLAGHRTRAVQQPAARRHDGEAEALARYAALSAPMDRWRVVLTVAVPRGFALAGIALLAHTARDAGQATMAAGAAGVLFSTAALTSAGAGLAGIAEARAAWDQLRTLLTAPSTPDGDPLLPAAERNHLLLAPLAMNVLLGRAWPAGSDDLEQAYQVCVELGLGPLLERMPGGMAQLVGETGWQLSAGERSLVFLARALLTDPPVPLPVPAHALDALDPVSRAAVLRVALQRAGQIR